MRKILQPKKKVEMEEVSCNTLLYFSAPYNLPRKTVWWKWINNILLWQQQETQVFLQNLQKFLWRNSSNSQKQSQRRGQTPTYLHGKHSFLLKAQTVLWLDFPRSQDFPVSLHLPNPASVLNEIIWRMDLKKVWLFLFFLHFFWGHKLKWLQMSHAHMTIYSR